MEQDIREAFTPTKRFTLFVNSYMLVCHLAFAVWYYREGMSLLYFYNFVSIFVFLCGYWTIHKGNIALLYVTNCVEILVFMCLNVILLGWGYGFQYYSFNFIVCAFIIEFYLGKSMKVRVATDVFVILLSTAYVAMRFYSYYHVPLYSASHPDVEKGLYLVNLCLTFILMIAFLRTYMKMAFSLETKLAYMATHDSLTGLANRRRIEGLAAEEAEPFCVAILDIDYFKMINDRYGHAVGDLALQELGRILLEVENEKISCGRMGGEEFLILARQMEKGEAQAYFEELRDRIGKNTIDAYGRALQFTVTIGIAGSWEATSRDEVIQMADRRLYEGKEAGRNRVVSGSRRQ